MAEEYEILFNNALKEWQTASEHNNLNSYNNAVSFLLLGIKKAGEPIPKAHACLAMIYYEIAVHHAQTQSRNSEQLANKSWGQAKEQANIALQQDPLEFQAQLVKTWIAGNNILYMKGGISNLIPTSSGLVDAVFETLGRATSAGITAARVESSKANFRNELKSLISIYNQLFSNQKMGASEFLYYSDYLMSIADRCAADNLYNANEIYLSILSVVLEDLTYDDDLDDKAKTELEQEVVRIKALAEGRNMM